MNPLAALNYAGLWHRRVRIDGADFEACSLDRLAYLFLHKLGRMGGKERAFFHREIQPGMRVVEAGANLGVYTLLLSRLVGPTGKVFAFEPDPRLFAALQRNLEGNEIRNVVPIPKALGSAPATLALKTYGFNSGDNRLGANPSASDVTQVEVVALDDILAGEPVDFVKMDVQGWELEVFRGMKRLWGANPQLRLYFEFWPYGLRQAGAAPVDLLHLLQESKWRIETEDRVPFAADDLSRWDDGSRKFTNLYATRDDA